MFSLDEVAFYCQAGFWLAAGLIGCLLVLWVSCVAFSYAVGKMDFVSLEEDGNADEVG